MSEGWWYFRATVDFATTDESLAKKLTKNVGDQIGDERLGRELFDSVRKGDTEIDSIAGIEDHSS